MSPVQDTGVALPNDIELYRNSNFVSSAIPVLLCPRRRKSFPSPPKAISVSAVSRVHAPPATEYCKDSSNT